MNVRFGHASLQLYAKIHQNGVNRTLRALGMPVVGYAVLGALPLLCLKSTGQPHDDALRAHFMSTVIYLCYGAYYMSFDPLYALLALLIYGAILCQVAVDLHHMEPSHKRRYILYYFKIFMASLFLQEFIGHTYFEGINSDLRQLPNSILISPLFAVRCLFADV